MKEQLERYAELKSAIKEMEAEVKDIQEQIIDDIELDVEYEIGDAVITKSPGRAKWGYSDIIIDMEQTLKKKKKEEELDGIAIKIAAKPYLVCNFKKK